MALHRCLNCGHTDDLSLTNFVCPQCHEQLELIPGEASMSIPLCTLNGGGFNHRWRLVTCLLRQPLIGVKALWQCDDCRTIVEGRMVNATEAERYSKGEPVIVQSVEIPS